MWRLKWQHILTSMQHIYFGQILSEWPFGIWSSAWKDKQHLLYYSSDLILDCTVSSVMGHINPTSLWHIYRMTKTYSAFQFWWNTGSYKISMFKLGLNYYNRNYFLHWNHRSKRTKLLILGSFTEKCWNLYQFLTNGNSYQIVHVMDYILPFKKRQNALVWKVNQNSCKDIKRPTSLGPFCLYGR